MKCPRCSGADAVDLIGGVFDKTAHRPGTVCEGCFLVYQHGPYSLPILEGTSLFQGMWRPATGMEKMEASIGDKCL